MLNAIEAIIFVSETPVREEDLVRIFSQEELADWQAGQEQIHEALKQLIIRYSENEYAFELREIAGGYQFLTRKEFGPLIRALLTEKDKKRLSRSALETLSIIAYRQPISKSEVEYIRGVNCDYATQKLLDKQLIETAGRSDAPGKPLLYKTSAYFMEYFGINTLNDLPKLQEIPADEEAYQEQFRNAFHESPENSTGSDEIYGHTAINTEYVDGTEINRRSEEGIPGRDSGENIFQEELEGTFSERSLGEPETGEEE